MMNRFFSAHSYLAVQVLFSVVCCVIAFLMVGYPLIMTTSLYHDQYTLYSFYRNSFLSVLHFGEIRWWDPTVQYGFPSYYFSFLGLYASTPLFWLTEGFMYVMHLLGIRDLAIHTVVMVYISLLIPLLFNLSFLALTRQIFRSASTVVLTIIMAAFSPGVLFSISDVTFEMTAYGMLVAAALLAFVRRTSSANYFLLGIGLCVFLLSFNHLSLYWNPLFLTVFGFSLLLFPEGSHRDVFSDYMRLPLWQHILVGVSILICLLPTTLCYLAGTEIFRSTIGKRLFDPLTIFGGNPLEFIMSGIPGIGVTRTVERIYGFPAMIPMARYVEYIYLGIMTIPLFLVGLIHGQKTWRYRLYLLLSFFAVAVLLGGKSAILSILYLPDSPFRAVRHFGDTTFRNGLFAILILAAGLGFETLTTVRSKRIRTLFFGAGMFWLFVICAIASSILFLEKSGKLTADIPTIGFMLVLVLFYLPVLFWMYLKPRMARPLVILVCVMVFLDLTCNMYLFERHQVVPQGIKLNDDNGPFSVSDPNLFFQENTILTLKDIYTLNERGAGVPTIPYLGIAGRSGMIPLGMDRVASMTYNRMEVTASAGEAALLVWRDSWFKGWEATVNGRKVAIEKYLGAFKAVPIGPGVSLVKFEFFPRPFAYSLMAGWGAVLVLLSAAIGSGIKRFRNSKNAASPLS